MTGLEKIIQQIEEEARASADAIVGEAEARAGEILTQAEKTCRETLEEAQAQAQAVREDVLKKSRSAAQMERKRQLLAAKQEVIGQIIDKALASLLNLPEEEYFALLARLIGTYAHEGDGEIRFNKKDRERLPAGFARTVSEAAAARGGKLAISDETCEIDGGFVLAYGGIEENCSFEAMFAAQREKLQDQVHSLLFA